MHLTNRDMTLELHARLDCVTPIPGSPHEEKVTKKLEEGDQMFCWTELEVRLHCMGYTTSIFLGGVVLSDNAERRKDEVQCAIRSHKLVEAAYRRMNRIVNSHGVEIDLGGFPEAPTARELHARWA